MRQANDLQFERWATRDKKQWFCIFAFGISIRFPFFRVSNLLAFSGISRIYTFIYISLHTHKNTLTLVVLLLDSNKFDKIFKFPWASAWHQIRISYQTARSFDSYSEKCKCSKAQCLLIHTHTHILCQSVIDKCSGCHVSPFSLFNWNAIKLMCQFSTHSFSHVPSKSWMIKTLFKSFQWDCKTIVSNEPKRNHKIEFGIVTFQCSRFSTALYRQ